VRYYELSLKNITIFCRVVDPDPDSMTCVDPDPDSESGSMGKKNEEKNALFLNFLNIFIAKGRK
jgi:hypothetical protein